MRRLWNICGCVLLFSMVTAYIDKRHDKFHDPFAETLRSRFGLVKEGEIRIDYSIEDNNVNLIVLIVDDQQYFGWYDVPLSSNDASTICTLPSAYREIIHGNGTIRYTVPSTDKYYVILALCNKISSSSSFHATVEMMNPAVDHSGWNYLPIERVLMLRIYIGDFTAFLCLLIVLLGQFYYTK